MLLEEIAVLLGEHRPPSGSDHHGRALHELRKHLALSSAKTFFAFDLEYDRDANTRSALNLMVAIVESLAQAPREQLAHRSLAGAHEPYQEDVAAATGCRSMGALDSHEPILSES